MLSLTPMDVSYVATDVGLWMSLPAFGPALVIVGVVFYIVRRDRRRHPDDPDSAGDSQDERYGPT
ncbi:hypothetical protein [Mycolicibacterium arseniciresistens]|uniref:Uncharacterized protein n=1 Tax=Mycolicibacterium arseniciresistens TaxID=3062257 RepID=A0ABT8UA91_9MYCO|nr:hypothetical protein [Mycolicibacterium arseniciresistens]MDO3634699.1 hypothetical protein [Mycolicibacterium arseniciresistens]